MEPVKQKRPLLATIICVVTMLFLANWLFHMLPGHQPVQIPSQTPWFDRVMNGIDLVLTVGGVIALWLMRPVAATYYAAQVATSVISAIVHIFFLRKLQADQTLVAAPGMPGAQPSMPIWATWLLPILGAAVVLGVHITLFLYVWRITSQLPNLHNKPKPV